MKYLILLLLLSGCGLIHSAKECVDLCYKKGCVSDYDAFRGRCECGSYCENNKRTGDLK